MSVVNTPMAARGLRADVAGGAYGMMTASFDGIPVATQTLVTNVGNSSIEKRVYLVDGQRVTIIVDVTPNPSVRERYT